MSPLTEDPSSCFLHIRGGVSTDTQLRTKTWAFSPHTWRCFWDEVQGDTWLIVFSTYVEVFPELIACSMWLRCFLHIRGGVSEIRFKGHADPWFSPHTWRCFFDDLGDQSRRSVFSTYVEVFLTISRLKKLRLCFLHIRGGVSANVITFEASRKFSPHTWRCFYLNVLSTLTKLVFSTYVEVFLGDA